MVLEIKLSSLEDEDDDEYNSAGFVEMSRIFVTHDAFLFGKPTASFDSVPVYH